MKTATLTAWRVEPSLRKVTERVPPPDEALLRLMEASLESYIAHRTAEDDFIARGLRSAEKAKAENRQVCLETILTQLYGKLGSAKRGKARKIS
jgi:hypothetical protein